METINSKELSQMVRKLGAKETARLLVESMKSGELSYKDFSITGLWNNLVTEANNDKEPTGNWLLEACEHNTLTEDAAVQSDASNFGTVTSQIYFNALTTKYNSADFSVKKTFKRIPSTLTRGELFGGISNVAKIMEPVPFGRDLPTVEPSEDKVQSPPMQRKGAVIEITLDLMRGDKTGETMQMFENLGVSAGINEELEAVQTLADTTLNTGAAYVRTHYGWAPAGGLPTFYSTYQPSTPWVNIAASNGLVNFENLQAANLLLQRIVDPFTGFPTTLGPEKMKLICGPSVSYRAKQLAHSQQYRTGTQSSSNFINLTNVPGPFNEGAPIDFEVVESKFLDYLASNSSSTLDPGTWFWGQPGEAFSWQTLLNLDMSQALPGSYSLWKRGVVAAYKVEFVQTSFAFNPRFICKNTP